MTFAEGTKPGDFGAAGALAPPPINQRQVLASLEAQPVQHIHACTRATQIAISAATSSIQSSSPCGAAPPAEPASEGLKRQDTPWPGWDSEQLEHSQQGRRQAGKGKAGKQGGEALPEEEPEAAGSQGGGGAAGGLNGGSGAAGAGSSKAAARAAAEPAGGPPAHPHHAGKPPGAMHGLDAEQGGNVADDLIPPLGEPDQP